MELSNIVLKNDAQSFFKFDPRIKILLTLMITVVYFTSPNNLCLILLTLLIVGLWFLIGEVKSGIKIMIYYMIMFFLTWLIDHAGTEGVFKILGHLVFFTMRLPVFFIMGSWFIRKIPVGDLIASLQSMRLPKGLIIALTVVFRYIPTIRTEFESIKNTMFQRNIGFSMKNLFQNPVGMIEYTLVPMLFRSLQIAEELSASAITRGLQLNGKRTSIFESKINVKNVLVLLIVIAYILLTLIFTSGEGGFMWLL